MKRTCLLAAISAIAFTMLAATANAAAPPTILTAGIDAQDHISITWQLTPGTILSYVDIATSPQPSASDPNFFAKGNLVDFECAPPPGSCPLSVAGTSYLTPFAVPRDRQYFVRVVATDTAAQTDATSQIWNIDSTKPFVPGVITAATGPTTNMPVSGGPFTGSIPPPPSPPVIAITPPKTIAAVLRHGVRVRVSCEADCVVSGLLYTVGKKQKIGASDVTISAGKTRTFTVRPTAANRRRLSHRTRARLRLGVVAIPLDDILSITLKRKTFTVRR